MPLNRVSGTQCECLYKGSSVITLHDSVGANSCTQTLVQKDANISAVSLKGAMEKVIDKEGASLNAVDQDGCTPLHRAVREDSRDTIQMLIHKGASIDATDKDGRTSLHYAAQTSSWDGIQALIDKGSSIHAVDYSGRTPFQYNS